MTRREIVIRVCDVCAYRGESREAVWSESVRVGRTERLLDVCGVHRDEFGLGDLADRLRRYGAPVSPDHHRPRRRDRRAEIGGDLP